MRKPETTPDPYFRFGANRATKVLHYTPADGQPENLTHRIRCDADTRIRNRELYFIGTLFKMVLQSDLPLLVNFRALFIKLVMTCIRRFLSV